jgi:hypothetical protein
LVDLLRVGRDHRVRPGGDDGDAMTRESIFLPPAWGEKTKRASPLGNDLALTT